MSQSDALLLWKIMLTVRISLAATHLVSFSRFFVLLGSQQPARTSFYILMGSLSPQAFLDLIRISILVALWGFGF